MSFAQRTRLGVESLDSRLVPAVLDLTAAGSQAIAPSGAIVSQYNTPSSEPIHSFVRMQQPGGLGGLLGGLLGGGVEQGYNTNARPVQFNESTATQLNRAIRLSEVPVVTVNGVAYRQFFLTINQSGLTPNLTLDEVRVFLGGSGNLSGYNASAKTLGGLTARFDLDTGGDVSIRLRDGLTATASPDMVLLIPDSAFAAADPDSFVYLYSKFSGANGGFEEWAVGDICKPPESLPRPAPRPTPPSRRPPTTRWRRCSPRRLPLSTRRSPPTSRRSDRGERRRASTSAAAPRPPSSRDAPTTARSIPSRGWTPTFIPARPRGSGGWIRSARSRSLSARTGARSRCSRRCAPRRASASPPPPAMESAEYTAAFNEVKRLGGDGVNTLTERTPQQSYIGIYWAYDGTPSLCAPPRLYNQIVVTDRGEDGDRTRSSWRGCSPW